MSSHLPPTLLFFTCVSSLYFLPRSPLFGRPKSNPLLKLLPASGSCFLAQVVQLQDSFSLCSSSSFCFKFCLFSHYLHQEGYGTAGICLTSSQLNNTKSCELTLMKLSGNVDNEQRKISLDFDDVLILEWSLTTDHR